MNHPPYSSGIWAAPSTHPRLGASEVHLWRASLDQPPDSVERLRQLLAPDEQARANRFHFDIDRRHFIVARGRLRTLLSRYLEIAPERVAFSYSAYGKPLVTKTPSTLQFNLAHSGGLALYAFTLIGEIGVDLEHIRPEFTGDEIARRFFSAVEVARLNQLPAAARPEAFFNCWTRKEAFIKAKGMGLSLPLDQFDVTLTPGEPAVLLGTKWDETEAANWSLQAIEIDEGYVAAVAVAGHDWRLSCWQVESDSSV